MTAILTKDPPDLDRALAMPAGLERIIRRCLEKSPDLRFQSATDLAFALETLSTVATSSSPASLAAPVAQSRVRLATVDVRRDRDARGPGGGMAPDRAGSAPTLDGARSHASVKPPVRKPHQHIARRRHRRVCRKGQRQMGHLLPARWRPERHADRQRSHARRTWPGVLARRIAHRVSRGGRRRRRVRRRRHRRNGPTPDRSRVRTRMVP